MNIDIVFVILNYNIVTETINCIQSIQQNIDTASYKIIVVDNASPNGAGVRLKEHYKDNRDIAVLINKQNDGFARGNNVGIAFARQWDPEFIVCMNNDTVWIQKDFYAQLRRAHDRTHAALIGPKIILKDGSVQYMWKGLQSKEEYERQLATLERSAFEEQGRGKLSSLDPRQDKGGPSSLGTQEGKGGPSPSDAWERKSPSFKRMIRSLPGYSFLKKKEIWLYTCLNRNFYHRRAEDVLLHGCCLIFSREFFEQLNGFNPDTFMFKEEELLYLAVMRAGLHTLYEPALRIRHLEDASTDAVYTTSEAKFNFVRENQIASLKVLIRALDEE